MEGEGESSPSKDLEPYSWRITFPSASVSLAANVGGEGGCGLAHLAEGYITLSKGLLGQGLPCACAFHPVFRYLDFQSPFPYLRSQWLWLEGGSTAGKDGGNRMWELGNCHSTGMGTLQWQAVRTGRICSTLAGPTGFVFVLCSLPHGHWLSVGVGSRRGARGGAQRRMLLAHNCFLLWCNQHSLILFDIFFFLSPFCCCYFSCFHRVGSFLPPSLPGSPFPCDIPET